MKYPIEISTPPASEPVSLAELKAFFREDRSVEDTLITQFGKAARRSLERHTGFHLVDTVFKMYLHDFVDVKIPKKPFKSLASIEYIDEDGAIQTLAASKYVVHSKEDPVGVEFLDNLPKLSSDDADKYPVTLTFTVGYGAAAAVPEDWKSIIGLIAMIYWKRNETDANPLHLPVVQSMIQNQMIGRFK